jgi:hypothetical protein
MVMMEMVQYVLSKQAMLVKKKKGMDTDCYS